MTGGSTAGPGTEVGHEVLGGSTGINGEAGPLDDSGATTGGTAGGAAGPKYNKEDWTFIVEPSEKASLYVYTKASGLQVREREKTVFARL